MSCGTLRLGITTKPYNIDRITFRLMLLVLQEGSNALLFSGFQITKHALSRVVHQLLRVPLEVTASVEIKMLLAVVSRSQYNTTK